MQKIFAYTLALAVTVAMGHYIIEGATAGFALLNSNTPTHTR